MKIGFVDVDSHNWPNLCLMKLSAYHKAQGDSVEWWKPEGWYDVVYKSRVFTDTYSKDTFMVENAGEVIRGGTGYGLKENLPDAVEHSYPDYSLYPQFPDTAYGFLSRGCPRNCGFCIVSGKEGRRSVQVADLSEFWDGQKVVLVYKCGQEKLNNLYYQVKEQRRCSTWRRTKNLTLRNLNSRLWICIMPEEPRIQNWNVNMA